MSRFTRATVFAASLTTLTGLGPIHAQLPSLSDKDYLGSFVAADRRTFQLRMDTEGKVTLNIVDGEGKPLGKDFITEIYFKIEESTPDGKTTSRRIVPESLQTDQKATTKPKDLIFKGKATGDIEFEASVSEDGGAIILGGRLINPAQLKNPTRFMIDMNIPKAVAPQKKGKDDKDKSERELAREREEKIKNDRVQIVWSDGKKTRITSDQKVEGSSKEVTGPGITSAAIDFSAFEGRKITATASPNSSISLQTKGSQALTEGFALSWAADPTKDPQGKARLAVEVR